MDKSVSENLPPGQNMKYETWKTLNQLRTGVAKTKNNLVKWKKDDSELYECGSIQDEN